LEVYFLLGLAIRAFRTFIAAILSSPFAICNAQNELHIYIIPQFILHVKKKFGIILNIVWVIISGARASRSRYK